MVTFPPAQGITKKADIEVNAGNAKLFTCNKKKHGFLLRIRLNMTSFKKVAFGSEKVEPKIFNGWIFLNLNVPSMQSGKLPGYVDW